LAAAERFDAERGADARLASPRYFLLGALVLSKSIFRPNLLFFSGFRPFGIS
jgi:hypothetical protein